MELAALPREREREREPDDERDAPPAGAPVEVVVRNMGRLPSRDGQVYMLPTLCAAGGTGDLFATSHGRKDTDVVVFTATRERNESPAEPKAVGRPFGVGSWFGNGRKRVSRIALVGDHGAGGPIAFVIGRDGGDTLELWLWGWSKQWSSSPKRAATRVVGPRFLWTCGIDEHGRPHVLCVTGGPQARWFERYRISREGGGAVLDLVQRMPIVPDPYPNGAKIRGFGLGLDGRLAVVGSAAAATQGPENGNAPSLEARFYDVRDGDAAWAEPLPGSSREIRLPSGTADAPEHDRIEVSPDGRFCAYGLSKCCEAASVVESLRVCDLATGAACRVACAPGTSPPRSHWGVRGLAFSPDSRRLLFVWDDDFFVADLVPGSETGGPARCPVSSPVRKGEER